MAESAQLSGPVPFYRRPLLWLRRLYLWTLSWAETRFGTPALFVLAFVEASFFPIPPDVLLMALALAKPKRALLYSAVCTVGSVTGAVLAPDDVWTVLGSKRAPTAPDEFESFLSDIASTVARSVDAWRVRLGERIAYWSGQGFRTAALEQALDSDEVPDVTELDASFATVAERLRALEAEAIRADTRLTGHQAFRDPDRLQEAEALAARAIALADPPPAPRPGFRLHDLVRWAGNSVVLQTVAGIINDPGARYNPLFVTAPTGSGKTHLAHAIGNALAARDRGSWTVACLTGATFMDELIAALQNGTVERWRARYRAVDALIVI